MAQISGCQCMPSLISASKHHNTVSIIDLQVGQPLIWRVCPKVQTPLEQPKINFPTHAVSDLLPLGHRTVQTIQNKKTDLKDPPIVSTGHTLLVHGAVQLLSVRKDGLVVDDDGFDDLIDMGLTGDLVLSVRGGHEGGSKADGQIIGVHHILIAVLGQAVRHKIGLSGHLALYKKFTF